MYLALKDSFEPDMNRMLSPEQAVAMAKHARRYAELTGRIPTAPVPETAITKAHRNALAGIVKWAACGAPMTHTGCNFVFVCPSSTDGTEQPCSTTNVDADKLVRAVMARLVSALNHEPTIKNVVRMVQEQTSPLADAARSRWRKPSSLSWN